MAFLAWAFGLGRRAAGAVAPLTWIVSSTFGGAGLKGVFEGGLLPNQLASTFLVLTLAGIVLLVRRPSPRRVVFTAAMAALTLFTHPIAAYILAFLAACLVVGVTLEWFRAHGPALRAVLPILAREDEADTTTAELAEHLAPVRALLAAPARRLAGLVAAGVLALGLAASMLVPLIAHPELRGENSDWGDAELGRASRRSGGGKPCCGRTSRSRCWPAGCSCCGRPGNGDRSPSRSPSPRCCTCCSAG
jgi:hypothetical protein